MFSKGCAKTTLQVNCVVGTDGPFGHYHASGTKVAECAPFANCAASIGGFLSILGLGINVCFKCNIMLIIIQLVLGI